MNIKLAVLTAACALLSIGSVAAQDKDGRKPTDGTTITAEQTAPNPAIGFGFGRGRGRGRGMGDGGGFGSPTSSGLGTQTFGGGSTTTSLGPLSTGGTGAGGGLMVQ